MSRHYMRDLRETAEAMIIEALGPDAHLLEAWSDAARAASAVARRARAKGGNAKQAARRAYWDKQPSNGARAALKTGIPSTSKGQDAQNRLSMQDQKRYVRRKDAAGVATYAGAAMKAGIRPPSHTPKASARRSARFSNRRMPPEYNW